MPKRTSIGLDIGSSAVRAAEVSIDGKSTEVVRFAQVGLPAGAVVEGEVRDKEAVVAALKRLWAEGGFRGRGVVLGVSSQRAMVRLLEMPSIADKELRSALRYEIGDLLPIPIEQAVFDFSVLGNGRPNGDGGQTTRVLAVVAQKDIVSDEIAVAKRAGLKVRAVDASALALLRGVPAPENSDDLDAVVSLGANLVVVAVREGGTPRFMRTATVSAEPDPSARAPGGSRLVPAQGRENPATRPGGVKTDPLVDEVRSSIEYFLSHAQGSHLHRVQLTGGGALAAGIAERLAAALGVDVVRATVVPKADGAKLGLSDEQLQEASNRWTTAVGLALWGTEDAHAPSLLPPEIEENQRRRSTIVLAATGVVVMAGGLGVLSHGRLDATADANRQTAVYQGETATVQAEVNKLGSLTKVRSSVQARRELAVGALSGDVDWVSLDRRIEKALPPGVSINSISFTGATPEAVATAPVASSSSYVGQISISAQTTGGLPSEAQFLRSMTAVAGVGAVWVSSSDGNGADGLAASGPGKSGKGAIIASAGLMTFAATAEVTSDALSSRASKLPGGEQ